MALNIIEDSPGVFRGPRPQSRDEVAWLHKEHGIECILSLQSDVLEDDDIDLEQSWVRTLRMFYPDMAFYHESLSVIWPPSHKSLTIAVDIIQEMQERKLPIYVHCAEGRDRSGAVFWAYDVWVRHKTVYDAYSRMRADGFHIWRYWWWLPFVARSIREGR